jgi:hypothetical protein
MPGSTVTNTPPPSTATPVPAPPPVPMPQGSSGTGLDQLVGIITSDTTLLRKAGAADVAAGASAADALNHLIVQAIRATGVANNGDLTVADLYAVNAWLRGNRLGDWTTLHGDDECNAETGFHRVQNDGASGRLFDRNAVDTVADGIYHLGFEICDGRVLNEDGDANASLIKVSEWLGSLLAADLAGSGLKNAAVDPYVRGSTGTGLDNLVALVTADAGLNRKVALADIQAGAHAADEMNALILQAVRATGVANDHDLSTADMRDLNAWLRANKLAQWTSLHGDDADQAETGFHRVQSDGATTQLYGRNAVDTVADGIYHLAFEICDDQLVNEDGNANVRLSKVASWLSDLLATELAGSTLVNTAIENPVQPSTGTGLDELVRIITADAGLDREIATSEINAGARAADAMNQILVQAIRATGVANNGDLTRADLRDVNAWIRSHELAKWTALHGDDESCAETGFHLVQDDGAATRLFDRNAVDTVADGIYHLGFAICDGRVLNEDGNANASLSDLSSWLNRLLATDLTGNTLDNAAVNPYAKGTTGTGLDQIVNLITADEGLNKRAATSEIYAGAKAADAMNALILQAIRATSAADGGTIDADEVRELNGWLRAGHLNTWKNLHGDDADKAETGFHLVQNDGATTTLFGRNAVDTVADGLYHLGFAIESGRLLNEDGAPNAGLRSVSEWLNGLLVTELADGSLLRPVALVGVAEADLSLGFVG